MEKQIKTIGVLTSGGDAPGMNAAVRAVVRTGLHKGYRMIGIQRGYNGLLNGECFEMNLRSVSNIISAGGTILYTARCLEFKTKEGQDKGAEKCVSWALMRWSLSAATAPTAVPAHWHTAASL